MEIAVIKFNQVNEEEFVNIVSELWRRMVNHDCVDGGLLYVDENKNIVGMSIPSSDNGVEFYLPFETEAA